MSVDAVPVVLGALSYPRVGRTPGGHAGTRLDVNCNSLCMWSVGMVALQSHVHDSAMHYGMSGLGAARARRRGIRRPTKTRSSNRPYALPYVWRCSR